MNPDDVIERVGAAASTLRATSEQLSEHLQFTDAERETVAAFLAQVRRAADEIEQALEAA